MCRARATHINMRHQPAPTSISQSKAKRVQEYVVARALTSYYSKQTNYMGIFTVSG